MSPETQIQEFKSEERVGHAIGPPPPIQCSGNTFFENFRTAGGKCDGTSSYMNPKGILVGRSTSYQEIVVKIPSHTFWKKVWPQNSVFRNACMKSQSRHFETFNYKQAANQKPQFRRLVFMQYFFSFCDVDPATFCLAVHFSHILSLQVTHESDTFWNFA